MEKEFIQLVGDYDDWSEEEWYAFGVFYSLARLWVCDACEILRVVKIKEILIFDRAFSNLFHNLEQVRIPFAKIEINKDSKLVKSAKISYPEPGIEKVEKIIYSKHDKKRMYSMWSELSQRGSNVWFSYDHNRSRPKRIERLDLSERIITNLKRKLSIN